MLEMDRFDICESAISTAMGVRKWMLDCTYRLDSLEKEKKESLKKYRMWGSVDGDHTMHPWVLLDRVIDEVSLRVVGDVIQSQSGEVERSHLIFRY